jgi:hypothetical protein
MKENSFTLAAALHNSNFTSPSAVEAAFVGIKPRSPFGLVIVGTTTVINALDVINNIHYAFYLAYDTTLSVFKKWNGSAWVAVALGQIASAAQINDATITLPKLSNVGVTSGAFYVLRVNATNNGFELVPAAQLYPVGTLSPTTLSGGVEGSFLRVVSGVKIWDTLVNVAAAVVASITSFDIQKLSAKINNTVLVVDNVGTTVWQTYATFFAGLANSSIPTSKIDTTGATTGQVLTASAGTALWQTITAFVASLADDTILPAKLKASAATTGQALTVTAGVASFQTPIISKAFTYEPPGFTGTTFISAATVFNFNSSTLYAGLGNVKPKIIRVCLVAVSADVATGSTDITAGTELFLETLYSSSGTVISQLVSMGWRVSDNSFYLTWPANTNISRGQVAAQNITPGNYFLRIYAYA